MRKSASSGAVFGAIVVALASSSTAGCASIWGFQDAIDEREGSADATTETALDGEGARPPPASDASTDGTLDSVEAASIARNDGADDATTADAFVDGADAASADAAEDANGADAGIDAAATACAGSCVQAAPLGWEGPFQILEVFSPDAGSQGCADGSWASALDLVAGPSADPASCTCNCGPPAGVECSTPSVSYFRDRACTQPCATPTPVGSTCTPLGATGCGTTPHFSMATSSADGGACAPVATTSLPPLVWSSTAHLCGPASSLELGACELGQACVPSSDSTSAPAVLCVVQQGDVPCPSGYGFRHTPRNDPGTDAGADAGTPYFDLAQADDGRGCTSCGCEAPTGATCTNSGIVAYSDSACTMSEMTMEPDAGCLALGAYNATCAGAVAAGGRCTPTGGLPTGGVTLTSPYTICCNR